MSPKQEAFIERLLLSSAISPATRRDTRRLLATPEGLDIEQAAGIIAHLQSLTDKAPKREDRPPEWRVRAIAEKLKWYGKQGRKPTLKPLVADLAWLAEHKRRQKGDHS